MILNLVSCLLLCIRGFLEKSLRNPRTFLNLVSCLLYEPCTRVTQSVVRQRKVHHRAAYQGSTEEESDSDSNDSDSEEEIAEQVKHSAEVNDEDDDDDWMKFQEEAKKENLLETKSKETHVVHCPYYPLVSYRLCLLIIQSCLVIMRHVKRESDITRSFQIFCHQG